MYYYRVYDLVTASEVLLPEVEKAQATEAPDVTISFGHMPFDILKHPKTKNPGGTWWYCFPGDGKMMFRVGTLDFEVSGGNRIVIDTNESRYDEGRLRIYLLGTALGVIHMQRGNIPVHGASIEGKNGVTIITGYSGSGKSAVLGSLAMDGFRFLADDVSVVTTERGYPEVLPGYPQRKLACEDAAELGYDTGDLETINEDNRDKYVIRKPEEWSSGSLPLYAIVEIIPVSRKGDGEQMPEFAEVKGHAALQLVMRNLYRRQFYAETGIVPDVMKKILVMTLGIRTYHLIRPWKGFSISTTSEIIVRECGMVTKIG